jgi:hypothetical protein
LVVVGCGDDDDDDDDEDDDDVDNMVGIDASCITEMKHS